jgi:ankyrin repeat protein
VSFHLLAGANVDAVANYGNSALMTAAQEGSERVVRELLQSNPNLELTDKDNGR